MLATTLPGFVIFLPFPFITLLYDRLDRF